MRAQGDMWDHDALKRHAARVEQAAADGVAAMTKRGKVVPNRAGNRRERRAYMARGDKG